MDQSNDQLKGLRDRIDQLDEQIVSLIQQRAACAHEIGRCKSEQGMLVYAPDREQNVLDRVSQLAAGPIHPESIRHIYREIMSASLAIERSPRVALLGPAGSFSHVAARKKFGSSVSFEMMNTIGSLFEAVARGQSELALVPVENALIGGVGETLDHLIQCDVTICAEVRLAVHHHVFGRCPLSEVRRVYSKPEVFGQCRHWLTSSGFADKTVPVSSSSEAAERAAMEDGAAAIASELAGALNGLNRLADFVEDDPHNATRFLVIGRKPVKATGRDKTSVVFSVGHTPGALAGVLETLASGNVNMTRLESRASRAERWTYYFFTDVDGHADDPVLRGVLQKAAARCGFWKWLGSYPVNDDILGESR